MTLGHDDSTINIVMAIIIYDYYYYYYCVSAYRPLAAAWSWKPNYVSSKLPLPWVIRTPV